MATPKGRAFRFPEPPPDPRARLTRHAGYVEIELSPRPILWRQWVRVSDDGIEDGVDLLGPSGARYPASKFVPWSAVNQIIVQPTHKGLRRLRKGWRDEMERAWKGRGRRRDFPTPVPSYGPAWFLLREYPVESEKSVCVFHNLGVFLELGSSFTLGLPAIEWLRAGLSGWGRALGWRIHGDL